MSKVIRISEEAYIKLNNLEEEKGTSKQEIIEEALEKLFRYHLLEKADEAYEKLKSDPTSWAEELEERKEWDSVLGDGLEKL